MSSDERELRSLFDRAVELPDAERAAFVAAVAHEIVRERLLALLAADAGPTASALRQPLVRGDAAARRLGNYELLRTLGTGGMGIVVLARQIEPIERLVAIKFLDDAARGAELLARFRAEQEALARMDHPGIARVLDGGTTPDGAPYFVMEYVRGEPLVAYCDRRRLSLAARVELVALVCDAVQHAHQKGVIHRDLKPSNVLVTERDGRSWPVVIDFGLARAMAGKLAAGAPTLVGDVLGTPAYMSPEQAAPAGLDIDTRTDIYSLGVVLYELMVGQPPLDPGSESGALLRFRTDLAAGRLPRASTIVRDLDPLAARERASHRAIGTGDWLRVLRGDLAWILAKALEHDRNRRYPTAAEFAGDLRRHLAGQPVSARAPQWSYLALRFIQRHRLAVLAAALAVAGLVTGAIVAADGWWSAQVANARLTTAVRRLAAVEEFERLVQLLGDSGLGDTAPPLRQVLADASKSIDTRWGKLPIEESAVRAWVGSALLHGGEPEPARQQLRQALLIAKSAALEEPRWELEVRSDLSRAERQLGEPGNSRAQLRPMLALAAAAVRAENGPAPVVRLLDDLAAAAPPDAASADRFVAGCDRLIAMVAEIDTPSRARRAIGELLFTMAVAFDQDGLPGSDGLLQRIEGIAREAYGEDPELAIALGRLAENRLRMGQAAAALTLADEQLALVARHNIQEHWLAAQGRRLRGLALVLTGEVGAGERELRALRDRLLPFARTGNARARAAYDAHDELARLLAARTDCTELLAQSARLHAADAASGPWWPTYVDAGGPAKFFTAALAALAVWPATPEREGATAALLLRLGKPADALAKLVAAPANASPAPEWLADLAVAQHLAGTAEARDRALLALRQPLTGDPALEARRAVALARAERLTAR